MKKRIKSYWSNCLSIAAIICSVISLIRCEPFAFTDSCLSWVIGISIALTSIGVVIVLGYQIYNSATLDKRMKEMFDERTNKVKEDLSISAARASAATLYQATGIGIKVDYVTKDFSGMIRTLKTMLEYAINLNDAETLSAIGAVSLQVNASGNIDVLDNAQQKLATVDSKTGQVTLGANDNATPTIQNVQNLANTFGEMQVKPTLSATDNATSTINSVSQKLSALDGKKATTTIVTKYKTTGTPPGHSARGANSWRGGLTYVNDQITNDPREVIEYRGMRYWYEGENILADIPKGARIYTAAESKAFIDGSHRNGLDRVPFDGYIAELHKDERVLTADEAENYSENGLFSQAVERVKAYMGESKSDGGGNNSSDDGRQIIFSPHIEISGNGDKETVMQGVRMTFSEFCSMMEEYERDRRRKQF